MYYKCLPSVKLFVKIMQSLSCFSSSSFVLKFFIPFKKWIECISRIESEALIHKRLMNDALIQKYANECSYWSYGYVQKPYYHIGEKGWIARDQTSGTICKRILSSRFMQELPTGVIRKGWCCNPKHKKMSCRRYVILPQGFPS